MGDIVWVVGEIKIFKIYLYNMYVLMCILFSLIIISD